jgi:hypothetical protein
VSDAPWLTDDWEHEYPERAAVFCAWILDIPIEEAREMVASFRDREGDSS